MKFRSCLRHRFVLVKKESSIWSRQSVIDSREICVCLLVCYEFFKWVNQSKGFLIKDAIGGGGGGGGW